MSCSQLVTPNLDPVLEQSGHILTNWVGWCLLYTQTAFHSGWAGSNAWEAWTDHVKIKHEDRDIPGGMFVPIWFSGYHGMGHSCIYKDGHIWSTPLNGGYTAAEWNSIEEVEQHYGVTYVGWSEDIGGTQVVEFIPDPVPAPAPPPEPVAEPEPTPIVPIAPPAGAAVYPSPSETYTLVVDCPGYVTSNAAANHLGASSTVAAGDYAVFNKKFNGATLLAVNVTHKAGVAGSWINPLDNVVPEPPTPAVVDNGWLGPRESGAAEVVAAPTTTSPPLQPVIRESQIPKKPSEVPIGTQADNTWKSSYKTLNTQNHSEEYELVQPWTMKEYSGKKNPVPLADGTKLNITGTFLKNGVKFYRTRSARDEYFAWWYAVPALDDNSRAVIVKVPPQPPEPPDNYLSLQDVAYYLKSDLSKLKIWDVIRRKKVNK
jgi:hypothetical protein